jgi:hypothetical protein
MTFYVLKWNNLYYLGYSDDTGPCWCIQKDGAYWIDEQHVNRIMLMLECVQSLPPGIIETERV